MRLEELVVASVLIEIRCTDCDCRTPVDPAFFLARRGNIALNELARHTVCPGCGSADITLCPCDPAHARR